MGLISGSASLTRFQIVGLKKQPKVSDLNENFQTHQVKRLRLQGSGKELLYGWSRPSGFDDVDLDQDAHWDISDCLLGDGLVLNIRIDKRKVPSRLLQMLAKERLLKKQAKRAKPVGSKERKQLWLETKEELLGLALPDIQFLEAYWNFNSGEALLFSTSKKSQEIFEDLFYKSFGQHLGLYMVRKDPPLLALEQDEWENEVQADKTVGQLTLISPSSIL